MLRRAFDWVFRSRVDRLWWAVDEIVRGVNPWRRLLGALFVVSLLT